MEHGAEPPTEPAAAGPMDDRRITSPQIIQQRLLRDGPGGPFEYGPPEWRSTGVRYLYQPDRLLVRDEYLDRVRAILLTLRVVSDDDREGWTEPVMAGLQLVRLRTAGTGRSTLDVRNAIVRGDERNGIAGLGTGVAAPNHLVSITGEAGGCPYGEPDPMPPDNPPAPWRSSDPRAGEGIRVVVIDTGFDKSAPSRCDWLAGVTGDDDPGIHPGNPSTLSGYAGHGTFIAGVVRAVAPGADVHVRADFGAVGAITESNMIKALVDTLHRDQPDIISLSAGTHAHDATGLLGFQVFADHRLRYHKGVVIVAAAGNDGERQQFWPAAAALTLSVGSLDTTGSGRAAFSNHGGWVDLYSPGEDIVNAFPIGYYEYRERDDASPLAAQFKGMARWSGTSFSTPAVAGAIAVRMSRTGENGVAAAQSVLRRARQAALPGVGAVLPPP